MFKQRLITTLILVPLVLAAIYYAHFWMFCSVIILLMLACGIEWLQLIPIQSLPLKILFLLGLMMASYLIQFVFLYWLIAGFVVWAFILLCVLKFPSSLSLWGRSWFVGLFALLVLPMWAQSLLSIFIQEKGRGLVVYLLFLVWAADIGAYLAGKQWGHHKLIPFVSPGKTYEGAIGGFLLSMMVALVGVFCFHPSSFVSWFVIAIGVALISLLGDLFISMLKRRVHLKDTGHLIPGHGGILDRLDSLIPAAWLFYCGICFLSPGL